MISGRAVPRKPLSFSCHSNHASCNMTTPIVSPNMASPILNEGCRDGTKADQIEAITRGTNQQVLAQGLTHTPSKRNYVHRQPHVLTC